MSPAMQAADALVLFGASGDLARRKLFPALHRLVQRGLLKVPVIGLGRSEWDDDDLRGHARAGVDEFGGGADDDAFAELSKLLSYVRLDYRDHSTYGPLRDALAGRELPVFYLAIPPSLFDDVVAGLASVGLNADGRVVVEKPFGRDLGSARELNECLHRAFPEESIFRIDHYLGKQSVQNLLVFRFANSIVEPIWNRNHVESVQITMAEKIGVAGRGSFYEEVGATRDVVQNHLLEIVSFLAMEPPVALDADSLRDEKAKVLRAAHISDPSTVVRGQYEGYRDEEGVAADSDVETFVAFRLDIDSWRWAGVPFYVRAGKNLCCTAGEVVVDFQAPPRRLFEGGERRSGQNRLQFRLGPDTGVRWTMEAKEPGEALRTRPVDLQVSYEEAFAGEQQDAYELLLAEAMEGDATLFARQDGVDAAWRVVEPLLQDPPPVQPYAPGTWGPEAAFELPGERGWHEPRPAGR